MKTKFADSDVCMNNQFLTFSLIYFNKLAID